MHACLLKREVKGVLWLPFYSLLHLSSESVTADDFSPSIDNF
jgi:hypothetical protein